MNESIWVMGIAALIMAATVVVGRYIRARHHRRSHASLLAAKEQNLHQPPSLHPVIDTDVCIGSFSCIRACPEGDILGIVDGQPKLVEAANCIGHGRCAAECPVQAIKLVFGTSERGVDLPEVNTVFETSRPGVHVVGELGGMGLIKNTMTQGTLVAEHLGRTLGRNRSGEMADVVIVGSGPAGMATALGLRHAGLTFRMLEQGALGGTIAQYPRQKLVMTEPMRLPIIGKFGKRVMSKEELLGAWQKMVRKGGFRVHEGVRVTSIDGADLQFTVKTTQGEVRCRKVVLATGRRGSPRKLEVPGEELVKVTPGLIDAEQYRGKRMLVVGGGDSALEAAIQLADQPDTAVAISYRGPAIARARSENRRKVEELVKSERVQLFLSSDVKEIHPDHVVLAHGGEQVKLANDFVITCLGGELPVQLLEQCGIQLKRHFGTAQGEVAPRANRPGVTYPSAAELRAKRQRKLLKVLWGIAIFTGLVLFGIGWNYYPLSRAERLESPLHQYLRSAGPWGHGIGIVATAVLMSNFLYPLRKRWVPLKRWGEIQRWLTLHMFVGLMAPLVIAFHSAFQFRNQLATATSLSLAVMVMTGLMGRFLFRLATAAEGKLTTLEKLRRNLSAMEARLSNAGTTPKAQKLIHEVSLAPETMTFVNFAKTVVRTLTARARLNAIRPEFANARDYQRFVHTYNQMDRLRARLAWYKSFKRIMPIWRVIHVSLAIFLVILIAAHIGVSIFFGYTLKVTR